MHMLLERLCEVVRNDLSSKISEEVIGKALFNPAGFGTHFRNKWGETPLMQKFVPEEIVLKCWPILIKHGTESGVCHHTAKGRT